MATTISTLCTCVMDTALTLGYLLHALHINEYHRVNVLSAPGPKGSASAAGHQ